ncbi:MAG: glycosyltransferase [Cyanobacteria bacterium P01_F01_bin.53]
MYVDIALSLNRTLQVPLLVVINSILRNTKTTDDSTTPTLRFNIVVPEGDQAFFTDKIQAVFASSYGPEAAIFRVREFTPPPFLKHYLDNKFQEKSPERRISRYMQYARLFLKELFPDVTRVIYLDGDTLVLGDIQELFVQGSQLTSHRYLAAVPQLFPAMFYFSNPFKMWVDLRKFKNTFNSGVLLTDLSFWDARTYTSLRHYLALDTRNNYRLYNLGDETVFNLMFKESYIPLHKQWNCWGYGQIHIVGQFLKLRRKASQIKILHWSGGHHKPWQGKEVIYSALWRSYIPSMNDRAAVTTTPVLSQQAS